jgi:hypothetical protein
VNLLLYSISSFFGLTQKCSICIGVHRVVIQRILKGGEMKMKVRLPGNRTVMLILLVGLCAAVSTGWAGKRDCSVDAFPTIPDLTISHQDEKEDKQ